MSEFEARIIASYGRGALVEPTTAPRQHIHCALAGRKLRVVCGDRVSCDTESGSDLPRIVALLPRRNLMERIDQRGRAEAVAANIDRLAIAVAPEPEPDWFVADRYWAAARLSDINAILIINKADLGHGSIATEIANYRALGLRCFEIGAKSGLGLEPLRATLSTGTSLLVGQSGVGKSTLVNALIADAAAQTAELTQDAEGQHTTSTARCYDLGPAAALMDAPGVRDFAPPARALRAAQHGFVEIASTSVGCRFADCRHFDEPGCAVRAAVANGLISARRYESYRRLARLYEGLAAREYR